MANWLFRVSSSMPFRRTWLKMARFGATDITDRIWGAAVYLFAIHDALNLGTGLRIQFPVLRSLFNFLDIITLPINFIYGIFNTAIPVFGSLVVCYIVNKHNVQGV